MRTGVIPVDQVLLAVGFGLVTASVLAIGSVGLSLQFGITNYINFAYGDFMALGAYIAWEINAGVAAPRHLDRARGGRDRDGRSSRWDSTSSCFSPFARRFQRPFYILIVTFGLSLILLNFLNALWGAEVRTYRESNETPMHLGPFLLYGYPADRDRDRHRADARRPPLLTRQGR